MTLDDIRAYQELYAATGGNIDICSEMIGVTMDYLRKGARTPAEFESFQVQRGEALKTWGEFMDSVIEIEAQKARKRFYNYKTPGYKMCGDDDKKEVKRQ
jgi:hypothetical protein